MNSGKVYAISGIDTDIGKSVATGLLAADLLNAGYRVITQKLVQTGCVGVSEDILFHRKIMGIGPMEEDLDGTTCPFLFSTPCSPHLAAALEGREIDIGRIVEASRILAEKYEIVLLEGAGGLSVPLTLDYTYLDFIAEQQLPLILVTSSRLGSINHTLNAFEIIASRGIQLSAVLYNLYLADENNPRVTDSRTVMEFYLQKYGFSAKIFDFTTWELPQPCGYCLIFR